MHKNYTVITNRNLELTIYYFRGTFLRHGIICFVCTCPHRITNYFFMYEYLFVPLMICQTKSLLTDWLNWCGFLNTF